jgi:hypothetical protein
MPVQHAHEIFIEFLRMPAFMTIRACIRDLVFGRKLSGVMMMSQCKRNPVHKCLLTLLR